MRLKGKIALVTGGGTGIGAAIAERFVADGAKVCVTGRRADALEKVVKSLPPNTATSCRGAVSKYEDAVRMVEKTVAFGGRLDVLVNNAGVNIAGGPVTEMDPEIWRKVIDVNLTGAFLLMKAAIPHMIAGGAGSVINISSLGGIRCLPACPAYNASKAGLIMLTKQAALDYGPFKVRCNAVCPGGVRTAMTDQGLAFAEKMLNTDQENIYSLFSAPVPLGRIASPSEIAGICSYLASDDSSFMTGAALLIDGGAAVVDVSGASMIMALRNAGGAA